MAEKYPGLSPYNYCLNNPLRNIDPDGSEVWGFYLMNVISAGKTPRGSIGVGLALTLVMDDKQNSGLLVTSLLGYGYGQFWGKAIGGCNYKTMNSIYDFVNNDLIGGFGLNMTLGLGATYGGMASFSTSAANYGDFDFSLGEFSGGVAFAGFSNSSLFFTDELSALTKGGVKINVKIVDDKLVVCNTKGKVLATYDILFLLGGKFKREFPMSNGFYIQEPVSTKTIPNLGNIDSNNRREEGTWDAEHQ